MFTTTPATFSVDEDAAIDVVVGTAVATDGDDSSTGDGESSLSETELLMSAD